MNYLSWQFVAFVLALLALYQIMVLFESRFSREPLHPALLLLAGSLVFYCSYGIRPLLFLLFTAISTFFCARFMIKRKAKKLLLFICIGANVAVWFLIKALPWTLNVTNSLLRYFHVGPLENKIPYIVPIGISYFTLQAIGYLVDVYREEVRAEKTFWKYLLFLSYFPAIVQGPISRYEELSPQLLGRRKLSEELFRKNSLLVLIGMIKKTVIADRIGIFVDACFDGYEGLNGIVLYIAALGYAFQIYTDFSGCVDMCRGVSGWFGIDLVNNFDRPYLARSIKDFWNRWHISLSRWLKDYVYIPLGGNRKGTIRKYINLLATFLVSGLWHGAGFRFFFWGGVHAGYQIIGQYTVHFRDKFKDFISIDKCSFSECFYQRFITFHLVTFAWIFFRSHGLINGLKYVWHMLSKADLFVLFDGSLLDFGVSEPFFILLVVHLCILFYLEMKSASIDETVNHILELHIGLRWPVYLLLIFDIILFGVYGNGYDMSGFMYEGF